LCTVATPTTSIWKAFEITPGRVVISGGLYFATVANEIVLRLATACWLRKGKITGIDKMKKMSNKILGFMMIVFNFSL
jgi:hypothetical protein